jgi:hypothetical protein
MEARHHWLEPRTMQSATKAKVLLDSARSAVDGATTLRAALRGIARALHVEFPGIKRVSLRVLEQDGQNMRVAAVWSDKPTLIGPGVIVRTTATSFPELLQTTTALIRPIIETDLALDNVLQREGIWSWVSIPVRDRGEICAMLSLSSSEVKEFDAGGPAFFTALGAVVEDQLMSLARPGDRSVGIHRKTHEKDFMSFPPKPPNAV